VSDADEDDLYEAIDKRKNYPGLGWISAEDTVFSYKRLAQEESDFRCMKRIDLLVRPIQHRTGDHVRAHIFLCIPDYYV
jgi:transposase